MKTPVVDYRQFRLSKLNDPRFSHLKLLLGWVAYFVMYFLTENLIPAEACHPVHCWLDDVIPFCEAFVIPYVFWYGLIVFSLLYFALYDPERFRRLMTFIIITQVVAMVIYIVYPTRQDLRPAEFVRDNVLTRLMGMIYAFDTSTGVCPSLHVAFSVGIASAWWKKRDIGGGWKWLFAGLAVVISISTAFVKQHSVVDILAAIPLCLLAEGITYRDIYRAKFQKMRNR